MTAGISEMIFHSETVRTEAHRTGTVPAVGFNVRVKLFDKKTRFQAEPPLPASAGQTFSCRLVMQIGKTIASFEIQKLERKHCLQMEIIKREIAPAVRWTEIAPLQTGIHRNLEPFFSIKHLA